jgi:hypothetical protein
MKTSTTNWKAKTSTSAISVTWEASCGHTLSALRKTCPKLDVRKRLSKPPTTNCRRNFSQSLPSRRTHQAHPQGHSKVPSQPRTPRSSTSKTVHMHPRTSWNRTARTDSAPAVTYIRFNSLAQPRAQCFNFRDDLRWLQPQKPGKVEHCVQRGRPQATLQDHVTVDHFRQHDLCMTERHDAEEKGGHRGNSFHLKGGY